MTEPSCSATSCIFYPGEFGSVAPAVVKNHGAERWLHHEVTAIQARRSEFHLLSQHIKLGAVAHSYHPIPGEVETGGSQGLAGQSVCVDQ